MNARQTARVAAALFGLGASPASADAIDGFWCHDADRKRMSISGPTIVTPTGTKLEGDYHRHFFSYVVPSNEPLAGGTVTLTLLNENTVSLRLPARGMGSSEEQIWLRCSPPVGEWPAAMRRLG